MRVPNIDLEPTPADVADFTPDPVYGVNGRLDIGPVSIGLYADHRALPDFLASLAVAATEAYVHITGDQITLDVRQTADGIAVEVQR